MAAMVYCSLWETNYSKCGLREKATQGDWLIGHVLHYDYLRGFSSILRATILKDNGETTFGDSAALP